jgi:hypothetical protein
MIIFIPFVPIENIPPDSHSCIFVYIRCICVQVQEGSPDMDLGKQSG